MSNLSGQGRLILIEKTRKEFQKNIRKVIDSKTGEVKTIKKNDPTGRIDKTIEILGYTTNTPFKPIPIRQVTSIENLIKFLVFIDKVEIFIPMDYIREGEDWLTESKFYRAYLPNGRSVFSMRKKGQGLYIVMCGEAFDQTQCIYTQTIEYLKLVFFSCYVIPEEKFTTFFLPVPGKWSSKTFARPLSNDEETLLGMWLDVAQLKVIEPCFPLGEGTPKDFMQLDNFHEYEGTLYSNGKGDNESKDRNKCYDMVEVNPSLEGLYSSFTKHENVITDKWVKSLSLSDLKGNAMDILNRFDFEVKGELHKIVLKDSAPINNPLFMEWHKNSHIAGERKSPKQKEIEEQENVVAELLLADPSLSVRKIQNIMNDRGYQVSTGTVATRKKSVQEKKDN